MRRHVPWIMCLALWLAASGCAIGYGQNAMTASPAASPAATAGPVDISYFYDGLASDGEWFQRPDYGWCWTPYDVAADWRPYSDGAWEYTDYGWSWASNESFGWATYHYGRWFFDDDHGWTWVPGTEWAPAWVAWRAGDDWVGWAPLPPAAGWDDATGLAPIDAESIPSDSWCFVPREHMLDVGLRLQLSSVGRNVTLLARSQDATRFEMRERHPADLGIDVTSIERNVGHPVRHQHIVDVGTPGRDDGRASGTSGVRYFRPAIRQPAPGQVPAPAMSSRPSPVPDADMPRFRDERQRKLEGDLAAEHMRLVHDQESELRTPAAGEGSDAIRQRHVAEQQAFDAHAARQRQVLAQRLQKPVMRPARGAGRGRQEGGKPDEGKPDHGTDKGRGQP